MGKRTIDGLVVRDSSNGHARRKVGEPLASSTRKKSAPKSAKTNRRRSTDGFLVGPAQTNNSLTPTEELGLVADDATLEMGDEVDWSDLLDQMDSKQEQTAADEFGLDNNIWADDEEELKPQKPTKKSRKPKKVKHGKRPAKRIKKVILIIFLLLLIGGGVAFYFWGDSIISRLTNGNSGLWDTLVSMVSDEVPFETDANGRTNVLIFGTEGYDMAGTSGTTEHAGSQLTDSLMVVSFDQETKDVALISLPRDLKVPMACMAGKINEVYTCHNQDGMNEDAGVSALMEQIEDVLGIDLQYWAHVNWGSVVEIVDAVGGITVTLDEDINDPYTEVQISAGVPTQLNGHQAVALARSRYGAPNGDFSRGNSQQKIVEGLVQKLMETGIDLPQALNLINILGDNLRTNFSSENIKSGVGLLRGFDMNNIRNVLLNGGENETNYVTTAMIDGVSFVVPSAGANNFKEIHAYMRQMLSSDEIAREGASIIVLNATDQPGLAGGERTALEAEGLTVQEIGDANAGTCNEQFCLFAITTDKPLTQTKLEQHYGVAARPASELPYGIWPNGADFVLLVGASGQPAQMAY